jgi:hypothetical protein
MAKITKLGMSANQNEKVAIDIGTITGTLGTAKSGNETIRLFGSHVVNGQIYYLTGNLTKKGN